MALSPFRHLGGQERGRLRILSFGSLPVVVGLLLAASGFTHTPDLQAAQAPTSEVRVNQVITADQQEPALAVDPTNPNVVLSAAKDWRTGPKQVWYYRSSDGGTTWADGHVDLATELPNQSDPVITFDGAGNAYMSVLGYNQNDFTIGGLFIARSSDGGTTWQKPVLVSSNSNSVFNDKEWVVADNSRNTQTKGNVYTTWTLFSGEGTRQERGDIMLSRSTDGGKTFSGPIPVSIPSQPDNQGSYPIIGPNGEVYILYFSGAEAADPDLGQDAQAEQEATPVPKPQSNEPNALFVAKSTDGGKTFAQVKRAASVHFPPSPLPGSQFRIFVLPSLAVDPNNGTLYATWNDYGAGQSDLMLVRSSDGGLTWTQPQRVNDDSPQTRHDHFFPAITVGSDSTIHMLWLDRRDDPNNKLYAPYYARSTDGGKTFSRNVPVSALSSNPDIGFQGTLIGDYIGLAVSGDGTRVYAAWPDTRNGNQDIYFSQFSESNGPGVGQVQPASQPTPVAVPSPQPLTGFTDEAFLRTWERADRPVATGKANRPWLWGPVSFAAANEPYAQGKGGQREVQYFDKARMEIYTPGGDRNSRFFVTNGLLVVEMISGRVQTGDAQFEQGTRPPAQIPVAGDIDSPDALTYASLAPVASLNNDKRSADRTGQTVTATLNRAGQVGDDASKAGLVKIARYEPTLGHNIPDVFWTFMNATGPVYNGRFGTISDGAILDWLTDLGYPITEPYWTSVRIGGVSKSVLVQAFQRRVLTFVPDNPPGWQVEMGNVGRQYYDWRYKLTSPPRGAGK